MFLEIEILVVYNLAKWTKNQTSFRYIEPELLPPSVFFDRGRTMDNDYSICQFLIGPLFLLQNGNWLKLSFSPFSLPVAAAPSSLLLPPLLIFFVSNI